MTATLRRHEAPLQSRLWILLFLAGIACFAACLTGAVDCALAKPAGLGLTMASAATSFLDTGAPTEADEEATEEAGEVR